MDAASADADAAASGAGELNAPQYSQVPGAELDDWPMGLYTINHQRESTKNGHKPREEALVAQTKLVATNKERRVHVLRSHGA